MVVDAVVAPLAAVCGGIGAGVAGAIAMGMGIAPPSSRAGAAIGAALLGIGAGALIGSALSNATH